MIEEKKTPIQIKGIKEGLLITFNEGDWPSLRQAFMDHVMEQAKFFQGAKVALDVGNHILHAAELGSLRDSLSEFGISLWAVLSNSPKTEQTAQMLGLSTRILTPKPEKAVRPIETTLNGEGAVMVQKTLRSGFKISTPGHVIVVGDVNPGAEIIAGGSVVIWGRLRGVVHAGAEGDEQAVVCALNLEPMQLRIAGKIAIAPQRRGKPQPEMARIIEDQVVAEAWNPKGK